MNIGRITIVKVRERKSTNCCHTVTPPTTPPPVEQPHPEAANQDHRNLQMDCSVWLQNQSFSALHTLTLKLVIARLPVIRLRIHYSNYFLSWGHGGKRYNCLAIYQRKYVVRLDQRRRGIAMQYKSISVRKALLIILPQLTTAAAEHDRIVHKSGSHFFFKISKN